MRPRPRTFSRHLLRRTARERASRLKTLQARALKGDSGAVSRLHEYGLDVHSRVTVESTVRGPFGWKVVIG